MDYNKSKNYLSSNDNLFIAGWIITAVGLLLFFCSFALGHRFLPLPYKYRNIICIAPIVIGLALSYLPASKRATAEELDQYISQKTKDLSEKITEKLEKSLKDPEEKPLVSGHYVYDAENVLIRRGLKELGGEIWNKPAFACLASRIPYGEPITVEKLQQIHKAEMSLRYLGFEQVRVRHHGNLARIEVPRDQRIRFADPELMDHVCRLMKDAGFLYATLDLEGYRMGSLNEEVL